MRTLGRSLTAILLLLLLGIGAAGAVSAQQAPPAAGSEEVAPGVTREPVIAGDGAVAHALYRLRFEPGALFFFEGDGTIRLAYMEAGSLTLSLDVPLNVRPAGDGRDAGEQVTPGDEAELRAGEYITIAPGAFGLVFNDGTLPAVVLIAAMEPIPPAAPQPRASPDA
jgi:hypothetical protein